jgi:peptidoglycan-associated lipoprotein
MKLNRLVFPLMLALVATMAVTGCKTKTPRVTPLYGQNAKPPGDGQDLNTRPMTFDPNAGGVGTGPGTTATSDSWDPKDFNEDRGALAAHTVLFAFDSAAIKSSEESKIAAVAAALNGNLSDKLIVEGHCDERGTEEYNRALGERRALATREALAKAGVSPERVRTISYGKDKPVNPEHNEAAWSKNRRADFILMHPKAGM